MSYISFTGFCKLYFLKHRIISFCFKNGFTFNSSLWDYCLFLKKILQFLEIEIVLSKNILLLLRKIKVTFCLVSMLFRVGKRYWKPSFDLLLLKRYLAKICVLFTESPGFLSISAKFSRTWQAGWQVGRFGRFVTYIIVAGLFFHRKY